MLFVPPIDLDSQCGTWTRDQLEEMNGRFVAALELAFAKGLESRAAARATVRVKSSLNGSRLLAEEVAIASVWNWFRDVKFEATAAAVVARVRASCPDVSVEKVREEFRRRLF